MMTEDSSIVKLSENIHPSAGGVILSLLAKNENKRERDLLLKQFGNSGNHVFKLKDRHEFIMAGSL